MQAAAGHGAALLQQFAVEGHGPAAAQFASGIGQVVEHQGVAKDVAEHLGVDGLVTHQIHRLAHQPTAAVGAATGAATGAPPNLVERQEGEPACPATFEQLDRPGGDAVVVDHHLAEAAAGGHFQRQAHPLLHFAELGHRPVDAVHTSLQQHPQGAGAAAFLQGFAAAVQPGDLAL